jgi:hypothetical protein
MARQVKNTEYAVGMPYAPKYAVSGRIVVANSNYTSFRNFAETGQKATKISLIGKIATAGVLTFLIYQLTKN